MEMLGKLSISPAIMRGVQTLPCYVLYVNTCTTVFGDHEDCKEVLVFGVSFHVKAYFISDLYHYHPLLNSGLSIHTITLKCRNSL